MRHRKAFILPVVLVMISLLALTMAGYIFFVRAETSGIRATVDGKQAELAAQAGFEYVSSIIRRSRSDVSKWYDVPNFRHVLVWARTFDEKSDPVAELGSRQQYRERTPNPPEAWRFSVVAERLDGPEGAIRYGITPENSKLNLNYASEDQLRRLIEPLLAELGVQNPQVVVDAILDWRDADSAARENGAENEYYHARTPPYNCKNGAFDTIEELLLVRGITAAMLYGEDVNRNGILDANEDDGEESEPLYDNGDGTLNRGIAPYLTVSSVEPDTALDNKPRIPLSAGPAIAALLEQQMPEGHPLSAETVTFLSSLAQRGVDVTLLRSPADLLPLGADEELELPTAPTSQPAGSTGGPSQQPTGGAPSAPSPGGASGGKSDPGSDAPGGGKPGTSKSLDAAQNRQDPPAGGNRSGGNQAGGNRGNRGNRGGELIPGVDRRGGNRTPTSGQTKPPEGDGETKPGSENDGSAGDPPKGQDPGAQPPPASQPQRGGRRGATSQPSLQERIQRTTAALRQSPVQISELPTLMDRFTARQTNGLPLPIPALININTAPLRVLELVPGMTAETAAAIAAARQTADPTTLATTAWPVVLGAVDPAALKRIAPYITTKAYQFHIEVVGYADHTKIARRAEWLVDTQKALVQPLYYRDLTSLGVSWPVDSETIVVTGR